MNKADFNRVYLPTEQVNHSFDRKSNPDGGQAIHYKTDITAIVVQEKSKHASKYKEENAHSATEKTIFLSSTASDLFYMIDEVLQQILSSSFLPEFQTDFFFIKSSPE